MLVKTKKGRGCLTQDEINCVMEKPEFPPQTNRTSWLTRYWPEDQQDTYHQQTTNGLLVYFSLHINPQKNKQKSQTQNLGRIGKKRNNAFLIHPQRTSPPSLPAHPTVTLEFVCSPRTALRTEDLVSECLDDSIHHKHGRRAFSMFQQHQILRATVRKLQWF